MGVITRAQVRIRRRPETESFYGVFFADWAAGAEAVREMAQGGLPVSMMRLSDAQETETTLMLAGKPDLTRWADRGLRVVGYRGERSLLILGLTGDRRRAGQTLRHAAGVCRRHGGLFPIAMIGRLWRKSRFLAPYLRNTLWERGYALDTVETALPWAGALAAARTIQQTLRNSFAARGRRLLVFTHLSHIYTDGASVYTTYLFPRADDPDETVAAWRAAKLAVSLAIVRTRGDHQPPARCRSRPRAVPGGRKRTRRRRRIALGLPDVRPRRHAESGKTDSTVAARPACATLTTLRASVHGDPRHRRNPGRVLCARSPNSARPPTVVYPHGHAGRKPKSDRLASSAPVTGLYSRPCLRHTPRSVDHAANTPVARPRGHRQHHLGGGDGCRTRARFIRRGPGRRNPFDTQDCGRMTI